MRGDSPTGTESEVALLRAVVDATRLLILQVDGTGQVLEANPAVVRLTGRGVEELRRPLWELAGMPHQRALLRAAWGADASASFPEELLFHLSDREGKPRAVQWDVRRVGGACGGETRLVLSGVDLSGPMATERLLESSNVLQKHVLERLPGVVWTTDTELRFTFGSGGGLSTLGLATNQLAVLGSTLQSYFHTHDPDHPVLAAHRRALEGASSEFDLSWQGRFFRTRVEPLWDEAGRIAGCIGLAFDVTENQHTLRELKRSEARLRRLVEANVLGIVFWDVGGRLTFANPAFLDLLGLSAAELAEGRLSWAGLTPEEHHAEDAHAQAELMTAGRCTPYEKELVDKDGRRVPVLVGAVSYGTWGGDAETGVSFIVDLREQVRLRKDRDALLVQEQKSRLETELANARLLLLVEGSKRLSKNRSLGETLSTLASLVVPALADWSYVVHRGWPDGAPTVASFHGDPNKRELLLRLDSLRPELGAPDGLARVFRTGEPLLLEDVTVEMLSPSAPRWPVVGTRDPGALHVVRELGMRSCLCVPIRGREGVDAVLLLASVADPWRYGPDDVVLASDLAHRASVSLENVRLLTEALESVRVRDEFLSVAAHELRTPLTSLLLQLQGMVRNIQGDKFEPKSVLRSARNAEAQTRRLAGLVDRLLDVVGVVNGRMGIKLERQDLVPLVQTLLGGMAAELEAAGCRVELDAPEQAFGNVDRVRIEQVLANLLSNALKFGAGRPIEVKVVADDERVAVSIRDHGIGISREDQTRIFGRFERAVSSRHFGGLGLGLYISAQILRMHQGSLTVESELGQGACFTVELPRRVEVSTAQDRWGDLVAPEAHVEEN